MSTKSHATRWLASLQLITFAALIGSPSAFAATYYWSTTTQQTWGTYAGWSDNPASGGTLITSPLSTDSVVFNQSSVNGAETVLLGGNTAIAGITFSNTGTTIIQATSVKFITNGSGGITIASGAGSVTFANGSTRPLAVALGASQSWINNASAKTFLLNSSTSPGSVDLAGYTLTIGGAGATTINTAIGSTGGGGAITKIDAGILTLTNANTYSGATTIGAGTLNTTTRSSGAGSYAVSDNATLAVSIAAAGQTLNMSSLTLGSSAGPSTLNITLGANDPTATVVTDAGALTLNGSTTVNVTGGASLTGATVVLLSYGSPAGAGSISAGTLPSVAGYTVALTNDTSAQQLKLVFTALPSPVQWAVGSGNWNTTTPNWQPAGGGSAVNYVESNPVVFDDNGSGSGPITVTLTASHTPGSVTVSNSAKDYILTGSAIACTGGLTKSGSSQLTLSAANTFSGPLTMLGGTINGALTCSSYDVQSGTVNAGLAGASAPLTKTTTGTNTLSGANTYGGSTTVSNGTLVISGSLTNTAGALNVSGGALTVSGGVDTGAGSWLVGSTASSRGVININPGAAVNATNFSAGGNATGSGALNVSGGSFKTGDAISSAIPFAFGRGGYAALKMSGGTVAAVDFQLGTLAGGTAVATLSGGTLNIGTNYVMVGRAATGVLTIGPGATLNHNAANLPIIIVNGNGRGELNLTGGTLDNTGQTINYNSTTANTVALLNLNAGLLKNNGFVAASSATKRLNFNGGNLEVGGSNPNVFLPAALQVYVNGPFGTYAGGAVINTAGFDITNAASLLAPSGSGVTGIAVATSGSGYIGAPYVSITGDGIGATAIADMVDDGTGNGTLQVSGIRITNPGNDYTTATATFVGGAATTAATTGAATITANTSGGLTKNGLGLLVLDGANTYTGTTTVNAGGLGGIGSLASPVIIAASATLSPGDSIGTLTINNNLTLAAGSKTVMELNKANSTNDAVMGLATVTYGGTLTVTNLGGTFAGGESYQLFSATTYNPGNFSATNLPPLVPGLHWVWTPTTGTLSVSGTPTPTSITPSVSGGVLTLTWPGAYVGWSAQSNSVGLASANDWHTIPGSQSVTNLIITMDPALTNVFYRLTLP
ncbi:MAG: autotransporter-associated beta strand repeat-containing protein [Verrucomicrobiae bacterium]